MWSRSNPPAASAAATSDPSSTTSLTRSAVCPFWYYNTSKRGITLNLETADGRQLFGRLAATADVILETFRPGFLASLGIDYEALREQNARLIMCSLTPFGQTGPWRDYLSSRSAAHGGGWRDGLLRL